MKNRKKIWITGGMILAAVAVMIILVVLAYSYNEHNADITQFIANNLWRFFVLLLFLVIWVAFYIYRLQIQNSDEMKRMFESGTVNDLISKSLTRQYTQVLLVDLNDDRILFCSASESANTSASGDFFFERELYSEAILRYIQSFVAEKDRTDAITKFALETVRSSLTGKDDYCVSYHALNKAYSFEIVSFRKTEYLDGKEYCMVTFSNFDKEKALEDQVLKREEIISALTDECLSVSLINLRENAVHDYQLKSRATLLIPGWQDTVNYAARMMLLVNQAIIPQEKAFVAKETEIENIALMFSTGKEKSIAFHIDENGNSKAYVLRFLPLDEERREALLVFQMMNDSITQLQQATAQNAVISALTGDFLCVAYVDLIQNKIENYRMDDGFANLIPGWRTITDYAVRIRLLADTLVAEADRERFLSASNPGSILRGLSSEKSSVYYIVFRIVLGGETRIYQAKYVQDPENSNAVVLGIHDIDAERHQEMEKETQEGAEILRSDFLKRLGSDLMKPVDEVQSVVDEIKNDSNKTEEQRNQMIRLEGSAKKLYVIANDIQNMVQTKTSKSQASMTPMNMLLFANVCSSAVAEIPPQKNICFVTDFDDISHPNVIGDELHLRQIIQNLLENAIRFTPENGKVIFRVGELRSDEDTVTFKIDITDSGNGMKQDILEHIWDIFTIRDGFTSEGNSDVSRNLAISKAVADAIGATITVESEEGVGTNFSVLIKLEHDREFENRTKGNEVLNGMHILLAEDNELNQELLREALENVGAIVIPARSGSEAVKVFSSSRNGEINLILMDLLMPGVSGAEATRQIRSMGRQDSDSVPLFAMVANASENEVQEAKDAGINVFLNKPVQMSALVNALLQFSNRRSQKLELELANANAIATTDALTGVRNRNAFEQMEVQIDKSLKAGELSEFAIVFCDVNDLKKTNDTEGHDKGDLLIKKACALICDIFKHSPVYRIGGDEFAVLLRGADYEARESLMATLVRKGYYGDVSIACGFSEYSPKDSGFSAVFKRADAKMYENKKRIKSGNVPKLL